MSHNKPGRKIVVVGGGVTGWMTALFIHRHYETLRKSDGIYSKITVVETPEQGHFGAEGSMPAILELFDYLRIPFSSLVKEAGATVQTGVEFVNWTATGGGYKHTFPASGDYWIGLRDQSFMTSISPTTIMGAVAIHGDIEKIMLNARLADDAKVPAIRRLERVESLDPLVSDPLNRYELIGAFSAHFDVDKMTAFLKRVAIDRGVRHVEGVVGLVDINGTAGLPDDLAEGVRVEKINLVDGTSLDCDDVYDCTGSTRRIIGQVLKAEWKPMTDRLPANRALVGWIPRNDEPRPITTASAMRNGWRWTIPVENRDGVGYVYPSAYCSDDEAHDELVHSGLELDDSSVVEFSSGIVETPWVGNCLAVGSTAAFVEPLEPASLWLTFESLRYALADRSTLIAPQAVRNQYARLMKSVYEQVADLIELHYYTDRTDTEFWNDRHICDSTRQLLDVWQVRPPTYLDLTSYVAPFDIVSWSQVALGKGLINLSVLNRAFLDHPQRHHIAGDHDAIRYQYARAVEQASTHEDFLEAMRDAVSI